MTTKVPVELSSTPGIVDGSNATAITIDSSENVGIGETSPLGKIHAKVSDTGASASAQGNLLVLEDTENGLSILSGTSAAGYINFGDSDDNDIGMIIYDHSANAMRFWTNAAERMRIDTNGKVGIGETSPSAPLTVNTGSDGNNVYIDNNGTQLAIGSTSSVNYINSQNGSAALAIQTNGTERMRIDSDGDIGINTSSPIDGSKLDVVDTDDMTMRVRSTGASSAGIRYQNSNTGTTTSDGLFVGVDASGNAYHYNYENTSSIFATNNAERMRINNAGHLVLQEGNGIFADTGRTGDVQITGSFTNVLNFNSIGGTGAGTGF